MDKKQIRQKYPPVEAKYYTKKYFMNWGNYRDFLKNKGTTLKHFPIYQRAIELAQIKPKMKVLDLGCGRGEILVHLAQLGAEVEGIDYSKIAIQLAKDSIKTQPKAIRERIKLRFEDVKNLKLSENYYDRIFMVDLIEHLRPWEVNLLLPRIKNALKESGYLIVHTFPNRLAFYGFCLYRIYYYIAYRKPLKEKFRDNYYDLIMHINEQTSSHLKNSLKKHNFNYQVWLEGGWFFNMVQQGAKKSWINYFLMLIVKLWPFKLFFFIDIYAIAWRKNAKAITLKKTN